MPRIRQLFISACVIRYTPEAGPAESDDFISGDTQRRYGIINLLYFQQAFRCRAVHSVPCTNPDRPRTIDGDIIYRPGVGLAHQFDPLFRSAVQSKHTCPCPGPNAAGSIDCNRTNIVASGLPADWAGLVIFLDERCIDYAFTVTQRNRHD